VPCLTEMGCQFRNNSSVISRKPFNYPDSRLIACYISDPLRYRTYRLIRIQSNKKFHWRFSVDLNVLGAFLPFGRNALSIHGAFRPSDISPGHEPGIRLSRMASHPNCRSISVNEGPSEPIGNSPVQFLQVVRLNCVGQTRFAGTL
jgi:hypothetical protein